MISMLNHACTTKPRENKRPNQQNISHTLCRGLWSVMVTKGRFVDLENER
jgi:hypothetical protein